MRRQRRAQTLAIGGAGVAGTTWGRAGGGGHGGSGHSSSHSAGVGHVSGASYGSGSFGGLLAIVVILFILWLLFRRFGRNTGGGFAANGAGAASAVVGAAFARDAGVGARQGSTLARPALPLAIERIRSQDPGFEIESFLQRAEMIFFLVKRGIQRNDAAALRPYVDDAVFAAVTRNIGQMTARHQHALMESLNVRDVHLIDAALDGDNQRIVVHFDLVYRNKILDDTNRVIADEGEDLRHGERWTFRRAATAVTPANGGVIAAKCPACGAELRLGLDGTCTHCRASVTNGTVDWIVSDVQAAAFVGAGSDSLAFAAAPTVGAGIAGLRAADAAFDVDKFLTRVRTGFLTLQAAWCQQNLDAGRAFLSPGAYFAWRAQLETLAAEGRRNVMESLEVREVTPLRVVHGRVFDDLTVRIAAVASDFEVDGAGRIVFGDKAVRPFLEDWTFQRSVGVVTADKAGTLESTCPNCGAPLALTQIGECRYCKAAVTSGKFDWVVSRIEQDGDRSNDVGGDLGGAVASLVGGAIVGGLLSSLLSQDRR